MNVFNDFKIENNLDAAQLDNVINQAFDKLSNDYAQFVMQYDEDGVTITNFEDCTEEETGGNTKEDVENNLTDELLKIANKLA